jgi:plastocyanin
MVFSAKTTLFCALLVVLALGAPLSASAGEHIVQIIGVSFSPQNITIPEGDTIRWINNSGLFHTSTSGVGCAPSGRWDIAIPNGSQVTRDFGIVGTFDYFCIPHCGALMTGKITVDVAVPTKEATWGAVKALYKAPAQ